MRASVEASVQFCSFIGRALCLQNVLYISNNGRFRDKRVCEFNLPLVANCLLESMDLMTRADDILCRHCIEGLEADEARCRRHVENSTAAATALLPALGYERACEVMRLANEQGRNIRETVSTQGWLTGDEFDALISPEAVCRLGTPGNRSGDSAERRHSSPGNTAALGRDAVTAEGKAP